MAETAIAQPMVGLDAYSLTGPSGHEICDGDIFAMLRAVRDLGADGLQASLPDDPARIEAAFELADELCLYLEPYIQIPIHWRDDAAEIARRRHRFPLICEAAARHGVRALHCTMGARERFEDPVRWKGFVRATAEALLEFAPLLREQDLRIGIENHWDFSTYEVLAIIEQAGADIVGFGLDTGNIPILGEAIDGAVERAAPAIVTTHLKDVVLFSTASGAARPVVPIGEGQVGMTEVVATLYRHNPALHFTIEDHPVIYPVDYFEGWWLAAVPELAASDIASLARLARQGDRWLVEHRLPDPRAAELVPWSVRGPSRLRADVLAVRDMVRAAVAAHTPIPDSAAT